MKINREARNTAKKLFAICRLSKGGVDETKLREVLAYVSKEKPRNAAGILARLHKLVELEITENTAVIEAPVALADADKAVIQDKLKQAFGDGTQVTFNERKELLGGIRIRRGSSVWDGSVQGRLKELQKQF